MLVPIDHDFLGGVTAWVVLLTLDELTVGLVNDISRHVLRCQNLLLECADGLSPLLLEVAHQNLSLLLTALGTFTASVKDWSELLFSSSDGVFVDLILVELEEWHGLIVEPLLEHWLGISEVRTGPPVVIDLKVVSVVLIPPVDVVNSGIVVVVIVVVVVVIVIIRT